MNEEEIPGVTDVLPPAVKKRLKKAEKRPLSQAFQDVPKLNPNYQPLEIPSRDPEVNLLTDIQHSPSSLFQLFITQAHLDLISTHTNLNASLKLAKNKDGEEGEGEGDISKQYEGDTNKDQEELEDKTVGLKKPQKICPWYYTTGEEIGVFLGVLLLQGEAKLGSTKNYWKCQTDR